MGINSYDFEELSANLQNLFIKTAHIAVPDSYFSVIKLWSKKISGPKKLFFSSSSDNKLIDWLKHQKKDVIIVSRGDPLWYGIGRILLENFSKDELNFYPSNTCIQLAYKKLKRPWQGTTVVSIHGRDSTRLVEALKLKPSSLGIITDSTKKGLGLILNNLTELNLLNYYDLWLCEELGFKNEKIRKLNFRDSLPSDISSLNIVILTKIEKNYLSSDIPLFGLKDDIFKTFDDRPNLLTKREIRIQILADLELPENGTIWDIGAGCGSIGLECLKLRPNLRLFCIDKSIGSKALIEENAKRLGVKPVKIFEEDINNLIKTEDINFLNQAKRIIIGGCDKKTKIKIINQFSKNSLIGDIIIIPVIDIESLKEIRDVLTVNNYLTSLNLVQTYKSLSISHGIRLDPNNPVFILKGKKTA